MNVQLRLALVLLLAWTAGLSSRALQTPLDDAAVDRAMQIARGSDRDRARFHAGYIVHVDDPLVEQIEIVSEFRRLVLIAEERLRLGDWMFTRSRREVDEALRPWRGLVTISARLRFNPLNVYVSVPPYEIVAGGAGAAVDPRATDATALTAPIGADPAGPTMITGAIVESRFDAAALGQAVRDVRVVLRGDTLASVRVDFGALD
jgi:hypothetical protein